MASFLLSFCTRGAAALRLCVRAFSADAAGRPIDLQSIGFLELRRDGCAFVDKTSAIADLLSSRVKRAFVARPRRFGKTLTLEVIAEMLAAGDLPSGVKAWPGYVPVDVGAVFGGLAVHERFRSADPSLGNLLREPRFVVKLSLGGAHTGSVLMQDIKEGIASVAGKAFGPELKAEVLACSSASRAMEALINAVPRGVRVAVLVDEYDAAILKDLSKRRWDAAEDGLEALGSLMMSSKAMELDQRISHFVVTGVARLARASLFSDANNFVDLTAEPISSRVLGFTEQEIREHFPDELLRLGQGLAASAASKELQGSASKELQDRAVKELAWWYNGYCFDGKTTSFNPTPVLAALGAGCVTGMELEGASVYDWLGLTPSEMLEKCATGAVLHQQTRVDIADLKKKNVHAAALLLQTGLLTHAPEEPPSSYVSGAGPAAPEDSASPPQVLWPPNEYARRSLQRLVARAAEDEKSAMSRAALAMADAARGRNHGAFADCLVQSIAAISASTTSLRSASGGEDSIVLMREAPYHTYLCALLTLALPSHVGTVAWKQSSSSGVADLVLTLLATSKHKAAVWVVEVGHPAGKRSLKTKLQQGQSYFNPLHAASEGAVIAVMAGSKGVPPTSAVAVWDVENRAWRSHCEASEQQPASQQQGKQQQ